MMPHFDALYGSREGHSSRQRDENARVRRLVATGQIDAAVDLICSKIEPRPAAHPCNSCDGIDLPILNDAGYCSACAEEVAP